MAPNAVPAYHAPCRSFGDVAVGTTKAARAAGVARDRIDEPVGKALIAVPIRSPVFLLSGQGRTAISNNAKSPNSGLIPGTWNVDQAKCRTD
jgi:hypothetical protein